MKIQVALTPSQKKFFNLYQTGADNPAFIAGVGSGKTYTMTFNAVFDATHSSSALIGIYEPNYELIRLVAIPAVERWLSEFGIRWKKNKNDHMIYTSSPNCGDFLFKNMSEPTSMVGYETYRAHCDELDTMRTEDARAAYFAVMARNRQQPSGVPEQYKRWSEENQRFECINKIGAYTTPEGYKFCYDMWVVAQQERYDANFQRVHAKTEENPSLSSSYKKSLLSKYPSNLVDAYLNGQFVNMETGAAYYNYDEDKHNTNETIKPNDILRIGMDFNVGKMAATVFVVRDSKWYAVEELVDILDTTTMIKIIKDRWQDVGHQIIIYPDASGQSRDPKEAGRTHITMLEQAGFKIRVHSKNPPVKDRVLVTNKAFEDMRVFINKERCPTVSKSLMQQPIGKDGKPDKNHPGDHSNDATTYPIEYEMGINNKIIAIPYSTVYKRYA